MGNLVRAAETICFRHKRIKRGIVTVIAAAGLSWQAAGQNGADSILGTWVGTIQQQPVGKSSSYRGEFTMHSPTSGTSSYPSLNCGGNLSGGKSGVAYHFRESITYGRATATSGGCFDGEIEMVIHGDMMSWHWSGSWEGQSYVASGTLHRVGNPTANWSAGQWVRGSSVANVAGTCFTTWICRPSSQIVRSTDSQLLTTKSQRTKGACQVTDNPEECGRCLSSEPEAHCQYCVQSAGCSDPNLGSRTREAMGCCPPK